ncbi:methyltransferase-like protein 17, mitochondrial, partial [Lingula anatina]|uniref:Methyltransferase-like protein 17, mitochondrial n=1 Tax=Lingula anatina TaxID=7574 RepID=A0A2R2MJG7_LINAN
MESNIVFSELKPGKLKSVKEGIFKEVQAKIHLRGNNWRPMKYNQHQSMVYMVARLDREYADLVRVFHEIKARDPEFKPGTLFDFGSGTGSVMWAANTVFKNSIWEHFLVDNSVEMHDLAKLLLHGGDPDGKPHFKNVYFRYNMPETLRYQNDLVVSAFSLFELSSKSERLEICEQMWKRTKPGGYMVLMELASKTAHTVMMEARDHILK